MYLTYRLLLRNSHRAMQKLAKALIETWIHHKYIEKRFLFVLCTVKKIVMRSHEYYRKQNYKP